MVSNVLQSSSRELFISVMMFIKYRNFIWLLNISMLRMEML